MILFIVYIVTCIIFTIALKNAFYEYIRYKKLHYNDFISYLCDDKVKSRVGKFLFMAFVIFLFYFPIVNTIILIFSLFVNILRMLKDGY